MTTLPGALFCTCLAFDVLLLAVMAFVWARDTWLAKREQERVRQNIKRMAREAIDDWRSDTEAQQQLRADFARMAKQMLSDQKSKAHRPAKILPFPRITSGGRAVRFERDSADNGAA